MSDDPPYMEWQPGMGGFAASPPSEHDQLREAAITIRDLTARAVTAEADLAVVVEFLRAVCHRTGESPDYWIGFFFDGGSNAPATLRRLLTEEP